MPSELCKICLVAGAKVLRLTRLWSCWSSCLAATIEMLWSVHVKTAFLRQNTYWLWPENLWKASSPSNMFQGNYLTQQQVPFQAVSKLLSIFWKAWCFEGWMWKPLKTLGFHDDPIGRSACCFQMGWLQPPTSFLFEKFSTHLISRDMFPSSNPSKPQGILSQAARICVFYYHCPSQRDFLNPELKVFWSF